TTEIYTLSLHDALPIYSDFNGSLSLPFPGMQNAGKYVMFTRPKNLEPVYIQKILYHIIDMDENNGLGRVIKKNVELYKGNDLASDRKSTRLNSSHVKIS